MTAILQTLGSLRERFANSRGAMRAMLTGFVTVALLTLCAKAMSFFKDATVAHHFGTADELDAFLLAFSFLSFLAAVFGGGMPEAFLPAYATVKHEQSDASAQRLAVQATIWHGVSLLIIGAIVCLAAPWILALTGKGFSQAKQTLAVETMHHLYPYFVLYGMCFHLSTWMRAEKKFVLASSVPLLPPVMIIFCLASAGHGPPIHALVAGTNIGVLIQALVLFIALWRQLPAEKGWLDTCLTRWEPGNRAVLRNAMSFLVAGLIFNSSSIVDQMMAAWLESGSVAVLSYTEKICGIVLALTATAASEAVFPFFADNVARREWAALKRNLLHITGAILLVAVPLAAVLIVFAPQIVGLLFERGSFGHEDTLRVAAVLRFAALQIPFYIAGILASRVAVSLQATGFTLMASVGALICNITLNMIFMKHLGVAGIALSTAVVHLLSTVALYVFIFRGLSGKLDTSQKT
jgi:putative peptidoglycan lipid II flippase